jgi:predicted DNA-binding transcriptional regulator AlpA
MEKCVQLLAAATTALLDLHAGFSEKEILAPSGKGLNALLRDLVTYLRENGVDDEGAWDCDATEGIEVRKTPDFEPFDENDRLIAIKDLESFLGISRPTIYRLVACGKFPRPIRIGRSTRWLWSEVDRYIKRLKESK